MAVSAGSFNIPWNVYAEDLTALKVNDVKSSVGDIPIIQNIIDISSTHRPGVAMTPQYITVHNTANPNSGADAQMHSNYLEYGSTHESYLSWHYTVDNTKIIQHVPIDEIAYHAGDGIGDGNRASIGIEICENADGNYHDAEQNAEALIANLLYELNLPVDRVVPHQHWSGKYCPHNLLSKTDGSVGWNQFIADIQAKLDALKASNGKQTNKDNGSDSTTNSQSSSEQKTEPTETVNVGEPVKLIDPLAMKVGDSSSLAVYENNAYATYGFNKDGSDVEVKAKNDSVAQTLNADSTINYEQTVKLQSSNYKISDADAEFNRLLSDSSVKVTADSNFFDTQNRKFKTNGLSAMTFHSEKGIATYNVYNYISRDPFITTAQEASDNGWKLENVSMNLSSVMNGTSQTEDKNIDTSSDSTTDTKSLISLMHVKSSKKQAEKKKKEEKQEEKGTETQEKQTKQLDYVSSNPNVITVSQGRLVAVGKGTARISTTINGIELDRTVTVS